jgi:hypothetical protein
VETEKKLYLGLDVSTSCTGFALLDEDGKLLDARFAYLSDEKTVYGKARAVAENLKRYRGMNIECVSIEQNMLGFRQGASSAFTLISLARFNGIVSYLVSDVLGFDPVTIPVSRARKSAQVPLVKGINVKEQVTKWVMGREPEYPWPTRTVKAGKKKGEDVLEKGVEDACDAYVMAIAAMNLKLSSQPITIIK